MGQCTVCGGKAPLCDHCIAVSRQPSQQQNEEGLQARRLGRTCPHCQHALPDDALYCPACGQAVVANVPALSPSVHGNGHNAASVFGGIIAAAIVLWTANYLYNAKVLEPARQEADFKRRVMDGVEADQRYQDEQWQKWKLNR
jgi:hypothetical protein